MAHPGGRPPRAVPTEGLEDARDTTVEVRAHTHLVLAYPAWIQKPMNESSFGAVQDIVRGERLLKMEVLAELLPYSAMTIAKGLIRLDYLRVNESVVLEKSQWEYAPQLKPHVWYARPTGRKRVRKPKAVTVQSEATADELHLPTDDDSWPLDVEKFGEDSTIADLYAYAGRLGLDVEIRLRPVQG